VNDAVVRKEIREVIVLSTEGSKTINLTCHWFYPISLCNGTLDFMTKE
jgi:hypothetical protein